MHVAEVGNVKARLMDELDASGFLEGRKTEYEASIRG